MSDKNRNRERGVALILTLLALMILSAIAATLVTMSTTETTVNTNYRSEEVAFFAARAGLYEVTDRMMQNSNATSISCDIPTALPGAPEPAPPAGSTCLTPPPAGVLYLINQTPETGTVAPWSTTNAYADDELCHEGYALTGMYSVPPDVSCMKSPGPLPSSSTPSWYATVNSNAPWSGNTAGNTAAMPYVWVRLAMKVNYSSSYIAGPSNPNCPNQTVCYNSVDGTQSGATAGTMVCWNGASEVLLSAGDANCSAMAGDTTTPTTDTPVYVVTALAVTSTGARQMVQTEVAIPPPAVIPNPEPSFPDGFFTNSNVCSNSGGSAPFVLAGGAFVDGYNSTNGGTYASTHTTSLGSIGSNGSILMSGSSTSVGGHIHVINTAVNGSCPTSDVFTNGGPTYGTVVPISQYTPVVPCMPSPPGCPVGVTNVSPPGKTPYDLAPGNYDNITVNGGGTLVLTAPGVFNINCITLSGNSTLEISPPTAQVVVNVTGNSCTANSPINLTGGTIANTSGVAGNLMFNYNGNQAATFTGGSGAYMVVDAPNANVTIHGGSDFYGAIDAATINDQGGVNLHFDNALLAAPGGGAGAPGTSTSNYVTISLRSLQY